MARDSIIDDDFFATPQRKVKTQDSTTKETKAEKKEVEKVKEPVKEEKKKEEGVKSSRKFTPQNLFIGKEDDAIIGNRRISIALTEVEDELLKAIVYYDPDIGKKTDVVRAALQEYMKKIFKDEELMTLIKLDLKRRGIIDKDA